MIVLLCFVFIGLGYSDNNTCKGGGGGGPYTQSFWSYNTSVWPGNMSTMTMCGQPWPKLMQIESIRMARTSQWMWVVAFHQMATASLNTILALNNTTTANQVPSEVIEYTLLLQDSLEHACQNVSDWGMASNDNLTLLYQMVATLQQFNSRNACDSFNPFSSYYELHTPDIIIIPGGGNNDTSSEEIITYSLLSDKYRVRQFLIGVSLLAYCALIPGLGITVILLKNMRKKLFLRPMGDDTNEGGSTQEAVEAYMDTDENGNNRLNINGEQILERK